MPVLKQDERRYAMKRVAEITAERERKLREKHTTKAKGCSDSSKNSQIRNGIAEMKYRGWTLKTPIGECFHYQDDSKEVFNSDGYKKDRSVLRKEEAKVTDAIMLGDAENDRNLLAKYESTV